MKNIYIVMQALILIAAAISCAYGFKQIQNGITKKYFWVALYGMIAMLFARMFYLVNVLAKANNSILTIDILGQGAACLFFTTANVKYITNEFTNKLKNKVCYPSVIGLIFLGIMLLATSLKINSLPSYIRESLYFIFMGNALYTSIGIICYSKKITECKYVYSFNICVCLLILLAALLEVTKVFATGALLIMLISIITLITILLIILMLPLLKKGVIEWKQ